MLRESEEDLLKLTVLVAKKIIQQELVQQPEILAKIISAAISSVTELDRVSVRLNPADYSVVNSDRQTYFGNLGDETHILLSPDESVEPGGCMVDTNTGTVDARIETQLDEIYRQFLEKRIAVSETVPAPAMENEGP
jgi:flagellar assembly protein FliH